jgi:pimeloyl-ACP methyl ester carboxylesterase
MLALPVASELTPLSRAGFDVFVFDFRGYGFSGGRAKSSAIISDYREIIRFPPQPPNYIIEMHFKFVCWHL